MERESSPAGDAVRRFHGVDLLRATMMLLGVVLHTASNYQQSAPDGPWPVRDPERSAIAGLLVVAIHLVRMPAFFVMAGFFAAMTWERRGSRRFLVERLRRIALPLVVGWAILFPIVKACFILAVLRGQGTPLADAMRTVPALLGDPYANPGPIHLWFLWYLLVMNLCSPFVSAAWTFLPGFVRDAAAGVLDAISVGSRGWMLLPLLTLATWPLLSLMPSPFIETPSSFAIDGSVFACYGFFYLCGWLLHRRRVLIERWKPSAGRRVIVAAAAFTLAVVAAILWYVLRTGGRDAAAGRVLPVSHALTAAAIWLLVIGGVGFAERLITRPRKATRLLVDASYWIYLAHLPLCIVVPLTFADWRVPAMLKMSASIAIATTLLLVVFEAMRGVLPARRGSSERRAHAD